jgi:hypothetical protein
VGDDRTGALWVAPELVEAMNTPRLPRCIRDLAVEPAELQTNGRVVFEWHPETGELSFAADGVQPPTTLPEDFSPEPLGATAQTCE